MKINKKIQRDFITGDSWLYYKIYSGTKISDIILTDIIKPVAEKLIADKIIDKWFFVRYKDPKHHLRVRFHFNKPDNLQKIIKQIFPYLKEFIEKDLIWKIQLDTYKREIERYGLSTMVLSEKLFFFDSKMIVDFLDLIEGEEGEELRWLFALRAIDSQLNSFRYSDEDKRDLLNRLKIGFRNEFEVSNLIGKQLNNKYRIEREKIDEFMKLSIKRNVEFKSVLNLLKNKEKSIEHIVCQIIDIIKVEELNVNLDDLNCSYIHMIMNRLFKSKNRIHEMVCYDFLYRYYNSMIARKINQKSYETN